MRWPETEGDAADTVQDWARSGAMALTGPPDGAGLGPPALLVPRLSAIAKLLGERSSALGSRVCLNPLTLLTERAAVAGLTRRGQVSCGGGTRLLPTADGWIAVCLARPDDVDLVPAWLGLDAATGDVWPTVAERVRSVGKQALVEHGRLLGLPLSALPRGIPTTPVPPEPLAPLPYRAERRGDHEATASLKGLVVLDLSALWAGPLCASLLAEAGAIVVKVESTRRPDGARRGPQGFFDQLNAGKRSVAFDLADSGGQRALQELVGRADVVIESSRPRALAQLGVHAEEVLRTARPRVWLSITAHGRIGSHATAVGFGDDAAVAGGLVAWEEDQPYFCADAVADPATGLLAATAILDALATGGRWLLDVALSRTAAYLAGLTLPVPAGTPVARPRVRPPRGFAPRLGQHTDEVFATLGVAR